MWLQLFSNALGPNARRYGRLQGVVVSRPVDRNVLLDDAGLLLEGLPHRHAVNRPVLGSGQADPTPRGYDLLLHHHRSDRYDLLFLDYYFLLYLDDFFLNDLNRLLYLDGDDPFDLNGLLYLDRYDLHDFLSDDLGNDSLDRDPLSRRPERALP